MSDDFTELEEPRPKTPLTPEEILKGPSITPEKRIQLYDDNEFEDFIREWAYYCLQKSGLYVGVRRFGGAGDLGRDVVGFLEMPLKKDRFDIYQCKHHERKVNPEVMWVEFAKLCVFTHLGRFPIPRYYYVVAPRDLGPTLADYVDNPETLRRELKKVWPSKCAAAVTKTQQFHLEGELLKHIETFPFEIVRHKPIHEVIDEFSNCPRYAGRFGGGLRPYPPDEIPPAEVQDRETRYVEQLLQAYSDDCGNTITKVVELTDAKYRVDLNRQRERFYSAETLRRFARDNEPSITPFEDVVEQMFNGVVDCVHGGFPSGYQRMLATMTAAAQVVISNHPLKSYLKPQSKQGICHQLANNDRVRWVSESDH